MSSAEHRQLPTGELTFMFTDIEGSTVLAHSLDPGTFSSVISTHHGIIRETLDNHDGVEVSTEGDAFFAVFENPSSAGAAAVAMQRAMATEAWPDGVELRIRIGLHTGWGALGGDNYVGVDVHRASRISNSAHGGQVVVSEPTAGHLEGSLPKGASLQLLGKVRLVGFREPEAIFQISIEGLPAEFPALRGVAPISHLPEPLTAFIGREEELDLGERLVGESRLVTLTGAGGSGKTRLSIELARRVEADFEDGAHFVSLASINDPGLMPATILEGLGINTAPQVDPADHLNEYLAGKQLLLVLDNLEQLSRPGASFVADLLQHSPIKVIATSRSPLRISGEHELPVPPLPVPEADIDLETAAGYAGVRLFLDRATAVKPGFQLDFDNVGTVLSLAKRLDGLPLALELAASQMRNLNPALVLERIDNRLLATRAPDVPERQQTIVNTIGWSYDLLVDSAKKVFERCSVFSGSFGLMEAEALAGEPDEGHSVLDEISNLTENSLLQHAGVNDQSRYRMLIVIKEYAYAALAARGEADRWEARHAQIFTELAQQAGEEILTSKQKHWLDRLTLDHDNMRGAFDWAMRNEDASTALRLVAGLWRFWQTRGHLPEARKKTEAALSLDGGTPQERAAALLALSGIQYWQGDWTGTLDPCKQALALLREHGTETEVADAMYNLSFPTGYSGNHEEAERLLLESLEISQRIGYQPGVGRAYWGLGDVAAYRKDWPRELEMMLKAIEELQTVDAPFDLGWAHFMTAFGYHHIYENEKAKEQLLIALDIFEEASDLSAMTLIFESLGLSSIRAGDLIGAARLAGAAERLKRETGVAITEVSVNKYEEYEQLLQSGDRSVIASYEEGQEMSLDEVLSFARS